MTSEISLSEVQPQQVIVKMATHFFQLIEHYVMVSGP